MAAEAISSIKDAETKGSEIVKNAQEQAKKILKEAELKGGDKHTEAIKEAKKIRDKLLAEAEEEAQKECAPALESSKAEIGNILNPDPNKLESTIKAVVERIVKANGYR